MKKSINGVLIDLTPAEIEELEAQRLPAAVSRKGSETEALKRGLLQQVRDAIEAIEEKLAAKNITAARTTALTNKRNALLRQRGKLKKLTYTIPITSIEAVEAYTNADLIPDAETLDALNEDN
jgi:hypothetical protein